MCTIAPLNPKNNKPTLSKSVSSDDGSGAYIIRPGEEDTKEHEQEDVIINIKTDDKEQEGPQVPLLKPEHPVGLAAETFSAVTIDWQ